MQYGRDRVAPLHCGLRGLAAGGSGRGQLHERGLEMAQQTPLYIVASPRPRVGRTLIARLLIEFFRCSDRTLDGYDLNPREPVLAGCFPQLVWTVDIADTRGQMALFDRLVSNHAATSVIDLGSGPFDQFFAVMNEIGFVHEARRRLIEPIVLYVVDPAPSTVRTYSQLRQQPAAPTFVPVHNEAVSIMFEKEEFPPTHAECRMIRIPRLSPIVRGVIDRPRFSFGSYMTHRPGGPTEIHDWIATIFAEFRQLELRLLMGRLGSALGRGPVHDADFRRPPRP
jgi:hypothetical protein